MPRPFSHRQCLLRTRLYVSQPYPYSPFQPTTSPFAKYLSSTTPAGKNAQIISPNAPSKNQSSSIPGSKPSVSSKITRDEEYTPRPLSRPLGQLQPPQPGENSGVDPRSWRERRDDFFNYDKHLARRNQLATTIGKPYFRDWTTLQYHSGKAFLSPRTLIRASKARYFPNLRGYSLATPSSSEYDTTPVLRGKVSVVTVFTGTWAHRQTGTFLPGGMDSQAERAREGWQRVEINIEETWMRAMVLKASVGALKKTVAEEAWERYIIVKNGLDTGSRWVSGNGLPGGVREALGIANSKVGYVFLVDGECRIRWAGSGDALEGEAEALARGVRRLVEESGRQERGQEREGRPDDMGSSPVPIAAREAKSEGSGG